MPNYERLTDHQRVMGNLQPSNIIVTQYIGQIYILNCAGLSCLDNMVHFLSLLATIDSTQLDLTLPGVNGWMFPAILHTNVRYWLFEAFVTITMYVNNFRIRSYKGVAKSAIRTTHKGHVIKY